jgi:peptide deformylase
MSEHDHGHDHEHDDGHEHDHDEGHDHVEPVETEEEAERRLRRQVALSQVRQYGDPVLRMRANEIETFDEELERLAERMISLMHDADGIGLAANQVGIVRRVIVFNDDGEDRVVVNPVLTKVGKVKESDEEGCLSLGTVRMQVERPVEVTLDGVDQHGEPVHLELDGLSARVVQHELDHLDGTLIIDRTDPESRREAMAQLRPRLLLSR